MKTISEVGREYGISRSTLLYYDSIGVLSPRARTPSGYRLYSEDDCSRLAQLRLYRNAGLSLQQIASLLASSESGDHVDSRTVLLLQKRLAAINEEIAALRAQQQTICSIMNTNLPELDPRALSKQRWTGVLRAAGFDDDDMRRWHVEFERLAPDAHQEFLESLAIDENEIDTIRRWSRQTPGHDTR